MYTADNMSRMLGTEGTNAAAEQFAAYLERNGWTLDLDSDNQVYSERNGEMMTEQEWQDAMDGCFNQ